MNIIKKIKTLKILNKTALIAVISTLVLAVLYYSVFASDIYPRPIEKNGETYLYFELEHNLTNAKYKYYGYGYTVSVALPGGHIVHSEFLQNSEFNPFMDGSTEKVEIKMRTLMEKIGLATEYFSMSDLTVYLNARMGLKENNVLKFAYDSYDGSKEDGMPYLDKGTVKLDSKVVPLNKDNKGIKNGIEYEYGFEWTGATQKNLKQHFGIPIKLDDPLIKWDRYKVEYREVATGKTVSSEKPYQDFTSNKTITEYPETVNGYEYSGYYKIDRIDTKGNEIAGNTVEGNNATINIREKADRYTIIFYYNKIDPSQIGKPVTIEVEYREDTSTGKELSKKNTIIGGELSQFNLNSLKIDGYTCKGHFVNGKATEYFYNTNASLVIGKENYSKPVNGRLKVIFIYEKIPYVSIPKCDPAVSGDADTINITMKKKDFENASEISINNAVLKIDEFKAGKDSKGNSVEGSHGFNYFDVYVGNGNYYYTSYDNKSKQINASFIVHKNIFNQSATDTNIYTANIDVTHAATCVCFDGKPDAEGDRGWAIDETSLNININLIENKPPKAYFDYYTEKRLEEGSKDQISRAYIGHETIINNQATDPNGRTDIKTLKYTLKDSNNKQYYVYLLMLGNGTYFLDDDNVKANNIVFQGVTDFGDLKLEFLTSETWTISQYVEDQEGLNNTFTNTITPLELNIKPIAVLKDSANYRYPLGKELNGKQNRVVEFNSNSSYVADFLKGTGVTINHNRDCWQIIPLDGQSFDSIKFDNDNTKAQVTDNVMEVKYTPMNDIKMMFKEYGRYNLRLQVSDTNGNVSEWSDNIITIHEDLPPTITANLNPKYYRNSSKNATIKFNVLPKSIDDDKIKINNIGYKFDSNNNGNFDDEMLQTTNLTYKDVNIDGEAYKEITLITSNVGKYQFVLDVVEDFMQETIDKYILESDYRSASITIQTEVDNVIPTGSFGLQKDNNIDVKILTSSLTGTKPIDLRNNLGNLKIWLESKNNIKVGNIEVIDVANTIDGLTDGNSLTWKKVTMNGYVRNRNFDYVEIENVTDKGGNPETDPNKPLLGFWFNALPNGVYADGWNGIKVPDLYIGTNVGSWGSLDKFLYKHINMALFADRYTVVQRDVNLLKYDTTYDYSYRKTVSHVSLGNLNSRSSIWAAPTTDAGDFSAISNEKLKDFDITFDLNCTPWQYGEDSEDSIVFLFNVQDKNNYFAYSEKEIHDWQVGETVGEILQIKNGVKEVLKECYYRRKKEQGEWEYYDETISRIKQVGTNLKAYNGDKIMLDTEINRNDAGGYLGLSSLAGLSMDDIYLNITGLTYIENSNMYESIDKFNWNENSDKYVINLIEGNKLEEFTSDYAFNKTVGKLQEKNINLINIGVDAINGTKLKRIISENQNNGTYIELGNIYNNLNSAATYIINKYNNLIEVGNYLLLGDKLDYIENYFDSEGDTKFLSEFRFNHNPTYFENSLGTISNNDVWVNEPIEAFSKTGKYTISYRVKDNPLYPDSSIFNQFDSYRKFSNIFTKDIYVHRKPIATYSLSGTTVTDRSYDLDHQNSPSKGIVKWEWYYINSSGYKFNYLITDKTTGENKVKLWLDTYGNADVTILLRVQDIEGAWSDWTNWTNNKPIANCIIDKDPLKLKTETQIITDISYDKDGYALTNTWNVYKDGNKLFMSVQNNIDTQLNQEIIKNGVGMYEISLTVTNTKGVQSDPVTKSFDVVVYNDAPTANFNLVSNENPVWTFPKALGLYTLNYRPSNTLFSEEIARFDTNINDPNTDNTGFVYNWKLERFAVKNISDISGVATNTYNYTTQFPFTNSFKYQGLSCGAYKITLRATDKPPIPPYQSTDAKTAEVTKYYYIVPEISIDGSFQSSKSEVMVGDTITLKATTSKFVDSVDCIFNNTTYSLSKGSEDGNFIYWKKDIVIPDSITESGTYNLEFIGKTTYGGNGNVTREVKDNVPIDIVALKLINFRITNIVNHTNITFPYTKDMLINNLIPYKTGYNVTFQIDSKGKPDNVYGRIDVGNNGTIDQNINLTKVVTGDTETWQGKFYTPTLLPQNTVISIKLDCKKGTTTYNYNEKENWDGRSLIINGSALQDGRINLTN